LAQFVLRPLRRAVEKEAETRVLEPETVS
jgi:hypothetical protein